MCIKLIICAFHIGGLAQWLEQGAHNALVGGSNPSSPTILSLYFNNLSKINPLPLLAIFTLLEIINKVYN